MQRRTIWKRKTTEKFSNISPAKRDFTRRTTMAQALFIHKHGKEEFFKLQNVMHKAHDFKKIQEILGQNTQEGLRILEGFMKTEADV